MLPDDAQLVSVNDHLIEPPDRWRRAGATAADVPRLETGPAGEVWRIGDYEMPVSEMGAFDAGGQRIKAARYADMHPALTEPAARLPLHDGARAAAEASRVAELGARAVAFPHNPVAVDVASFYSDEWDRLFDTLAEAGLGVLLHIGQGVGTPEGQQFGSLGALLTDMNFDVMASLVDFVFSKRDAVRDPGLPLPSAVARTASASFISDPNAVRWRQRIGVHRLLWQSDFPHQEGFWPNSRQHLAAELAEVPDDEARRIAELNARDLLNLPRPV